jgi:hypothetical protein
MLNEKHSFWLWIVLAASSLHVLEEHEMDWLGWSQQTLGFTSTTWAGFYVTNLAMEFILIACAQIAWRFPEVSLSGAALVAINAVFFHILPTIAKGVYSPGTVTAVLLYLPVSFMAYRGAYLDGVLKRRALVVSLLLGAIMMFSAAAIQAWKNH